MSFYFQPSSMRKTTISKGYNDIQSVSLSLSLSAPLSLCLSLSLPLPLSLFLSLCLCPPPPPCLPLYLPLSLFFCRSLSLPLPPLSLCLSVCLSIYIYRVVSGGVSGHLPWQQGVCRPDRRCGTQRHVTDGSVPVKIPQQANHSSASSGS